MSENVDTMQEDAGEQIRVSFVLDSSVSDRSLEVPSQPIAIPANLKRKGLSAVINHLLDRHEDEEDGSGNEQDSEEEDDDRLKALPFDFLVENKLLRTGVETAARRYGLSLEKPVTLTYFVKQTAPEKSGEGEPSPDWISAVAFKGGTLCTGGYDGALVVHRPDKLTSVASAAAHTGGIRCLAAMEDSEDLLIATGSLDQTLVTHRWKPDEKELVMHARYKEGHTASIGCVDMFAPTEKMASGDWGGGLCLWDLAATESDVAVEEPTKKLKSSSKKKKAAKPLEVNPVVSFQAHGSQISGVSWGNSPQATGKTLVTGSWDHSVKVWDIERQDCLLTLNGSRVVACLDSSYHSEVVATGHPDCTVRLWDVRVNISGEASSSLVSDSSLKPSHRAWVSAVQWSPKDPYMLASTSHDGSIKIWDIRSSLPLYTVRAHPKDEKGLCLCYGEGVLFAGGTDGKMKQYKL